MDCVGFICGVLFFSQCIVGPSPYYGTVCDDCACKFDADEDGDVDLRDFAAYQVNYDPT